VKRRHLDHFFERASWAASRLVGVAPSRLETLDHAALAASGVAMLDPKASAARKSLGGRGVTGFDLGWGLMHLPVTSGQIAEVRSSLKPHDVHGFDVALALRIGDNGSIPGALAASGLVSPSVEAGYAIAHGAVHAPSKQASALVATAMATPGGALGAQRAAGEIRRAGRGLGLWDGVLIAAGTLVGGFVGGSLVWAAVGGAAGGVADLVRRKVQP
jgi:hypothetical protein